jgi:hypothetical protein
MSAFTEVPDGKEWLTGLLRQGPVTVKFKKVDGTERTMKCTLSEDLILPYPVSESKREKKQNDEVLAVTFGVISASFLDSKAFIASFCLA